MKLALAMAALVLAAAPSAASAESDTATFALIATNNKSLDLGRRDLIYADDDGAKYYELFSMMTSEDRVTLLTELDSDTAGLFPRLAALARPPTRAELDRAVSDIARRARAARRAGDRVQFYFVFAGHGDVDRGRGFLELADGRLDAGGLADLLAEVPSHEAHVILDSCNSFFVINPRKPGGRRFSTPRDLGEEAAKRLENVGVLLSTSAEAEVFEWSALQSGIFSHSVRSGLAGAADADGDGRVTYAELEAFVDIASAGVKNPLYRPKVYARGPGGSKKATIFDLREVRAATLELGGEKPRRIRIRDRDALPWIDLFAEAGSRMAIRLPARVAEAATVEELEAKSGSRVARRLLYRAGEDGARVKLASLSTAASGERGRGGSHLFRMLFSRPFGPRALAEYAASQLEEPVPVYGISAEDTERMHLLLRHTAGIDKQQRLLKAGSLAAAGLIAAGAGLYLLESSDDPLDTLQSTRDQQILAAGLLGTGAIGLALGGVVAAQPSGGERAYSRFRTDLARYPGDPARAVANAELGLAEISRSERVWRRSFEVSSWIAAGLSAGGLVANELWSPDRYRVEARYLLAGGAVGGVAIALILRENITPAERMTEIWRSDPGIRSLPRVGVVPVRKGAVVSLGGAL